MSKPLSDYDKLRFSNYSKLPKTSAICIRLNIIFKSDYCHFLRIIFSVHKTVKYNILQFMSDTNATSSEKAD